MNTIIELREKIKEGLRKRFPALVEVPGLEAAVETEIEKWEDRGKLKYRRGSTAHLKDLRVDENQKAIAF